MAVFGVASTVRPYLVTCIAAVGWSISTLSAAITAHFQSVLLITRLLHALPPIGLRA